MKNLICLTVLTYMAWSGNAVAQPGTLDQTFGTNGIAAIDFNNEEEDPRFALLQDDGKILVSGQMTNNVEDDFMVIRVNPDGTPDNTFGTGGLVQIDLSGANLEDKGRGLYVLPNDQIMVCGRVENTVTGKLDIHLTRLNADGSLDLSFGTGGTVIHGSPNTDHYLGKLLVQSDGKYVLTGRIDDFGFADLAMTRLNTDGNIDFSFGLNGYVLYDTFGSFDIAANSVLLANDEILNVGWAFDPNINDNVRVLTKFQADGTIDASFGTNGLVVVDDLSGEDVYRGLAVKNNSIYAAGYSDVTGDNDMVINKFDMNGTQDMSFGTNGNVFLDHAGNDDDCRELYVDDDDKIYVAGTVKNSINEEDFALVRLNPDGSPDTDFGAGGWFIQDYMGEDDLEDMVVQDDGKIVLVGRSDELNPTQDLLMMRVNTAPSIGITENDLVKVHVFPNPAEETLQITGISHLTQISIVDMNGRLLQSQAVVENGSIDISHLKAAAYQLIIDTDYDRTVVPFIKKE